MAAPTPVTYTEWNGTRGMTYWRAEWTTSDQITDGVVVDISGLGAPVPNSVRVLGAKCSINGDVEAMLEFDATTDQLIYVFEGQTDASLVDVVDFREGPNGGRSPNPGAAGFVGDILITTVNAASGDEITVLVFYERKT